MSHPPHEEPWTTVPRSKKKKHNRPNPPQPIPQSLSTPSKDITPLSLHQSFTTKLSTFHQTPSTRKSLLSTLTRLKPSTGGWQLTNAICLASGSFSSTNLTNRERALWQLVVFVEMVKFLREEQASNHHDEDIDERNAIKVYAQEPRYGQVDKQFLEGLGIEVLEIDDEGVLKDEEHESELRHERGLGPAGEVLGKGSFIYEPFMAMGREQLKQVVEADPGLYVGSAMVWRNYGERVEGAEWAERFAVGRRMYNFPTFEPDWTVFDGMAIFGREEEDGEEE